MLDRKVSLTELAGRVDLTLANLSILKTNKARAIRFSTLEALCRELGCQPGDLLRHVEEPAAAAPPRDRVNRRQAPWGRGPCKVPDWPPEKFRTNGENCHAPGMHLERLSGPARNGGLALALAAALAQPRGAAGQDAPARSAAGAGTALGVDLYRIFAAGGWQRLLLALQRLGGAGPPLLGR